MKKKQLSKILVAYDGSPGAKIALDDLLLAALPPEGQAVIVCVADVWVPPHDEQSRKEETTSAKEVAESSPQISEAKNMRYKAIESAREAIHEAREIAEAGRARFCSLFPHWQVRAEACADSTAWGLLSKERKWQPDLIVLGATSHSLVDNWRFGSTAQKVVAEARSSVRVGRAANKSIATPLRLLLGLDGSPDAQAALCLLAARQWPRGSELRVFTALDQRMVSGMVSGLPTVGRWLGNQECENEFAWAYQMAHHAAEQLRALGLDASWTAQEGDSKHALLLEARRWEADSMFIGAQGLVGSSGLRYLERAVLGSTATVVSTHAPCSVEVIRSNALNAL